MQDLPKRVASSATCWCCWWWFASRGYQILETKRLDKERLGRRCAYAWDVAQVLERQMGDKVEAVAGRRGTAAPSKSSRGGARCRTLRSVDWRAQSTAMLAVRGG